MKKNFLSVLILGCTLVNIVLSAVTLFSVVTTNRETGKIIGSVADILDVKLDATSDAGQKDIPIEDPLVCQFIKEGYAALDAERQEKYVLNDKGADFLHTYIKRISAALTFIDINVSRNLSLMESRCMGAVYSLLFLSLDIGSFAPRGSTGR